MGELRLFKQDEFDELVDDLNHRFDQSVGRVLLLEKPLSEKQNAVIQQTPGVLCFAVKSPAWEGISWPPYLLGFIANPLDDQELRWALEQSRMNLEIRHRLEQLYIRLELEREQRRELMESALELTSERELPKLCEKVLTRLRKLVQAEGASLFLVDQQRQELRFSQVQNEKVPVHWKEIRLPINSESLVGHTVLSRKLIHIPDAYELPADVPFRFNRSFDESNGYRTRAIVSLPLQKTDGEVVGVVQLINSKRSIDFSDFEIELAKALAAHIAVAIETALLYDSIEKLFEGFIKASVVAIEARDPTTSGHSERVAALTVCLAEKVSDSSQPLFRSYHFGERQLKEIRYASLLHDFGKIGVSEPVLLKQKKLYSHELSELENRYRVFKIAHPGRREEFEKIWKQILLANEPSLLVEEIKNDLHRLVDQPVEIGNEILPLLTESEFARLSVKKGSLSEEERKQIESHVVHTFRFLSQIPWTRELARVPEIAAHHHERLDGTGYPSRLKAEAIPLESQIMAVADVFDALTAMDRPYKKAVPPSRALEILKLEAKELKLSMDLVRLFEEQRVFDAIKLG